MNDKEYSAWLQTGRRLAAAAKRRIAARKGDGPELARMYDDLILAMLSVFDAYDKSRPFYEHGERVDYQTLVSVVADKQDGMLELWSQLIHTPREKCAECPPTPQQHEALISVTRALVDLLCTISDETDRRNRDDCISGKWWDDNDSCSEIFHWQYWVFVKLITEVNICEVDNCFKYETVGEELAEEGYLPGNFVFDDDSEDEKEMWESVKEKFFSSDPTWALGICDYFLSMEVADYPQAFCIKPFSGHIMRLDHAVLRALKIEYELKFNGDNETMMWDPCRALTQAAYDVRWTIIDYIRRARSMCVKSSLSYRKWLEAEAEIITHSGIDADPITPEIAEHIVALANEAALEHWIEVRMEADSADRDAAMDRLLRDSFDRFERVADGIPGRVVDALKDKGGRPRKAKGGAAILTQREMAEAFGEPCTTEMVANWEAYTAGKRRGSKPPDAVYKGERIVYTAELRTDPTPENQNRLSALISDYQFRHRTKDAVRQKAMIHCRSEETLYRARSRYGA